MTIPTISDRERLTEPSMLKTILFLFAIFTIFFAANSKDFQTKHAAHLVGVGSAFVAGLLVGIDGRR